MVYRVGELIMTFCIRPATLQLNQVITHCLFPSLPSVRILFRHIAGAPSKSLLVHADREPGTKSYSVVYLPFLLPSLRVVVCSFTFPWTINRLPIYSLPFSFLLEKTQSIKPFRKFYTFLSGFVNFSVFL